MNAINNTKLMTVLGAVMVAASLTTNTAQATDLNEFTAQAQARVLDEATARPSASDRVAELEGALSGARVVADPVPVAGQRAKALARIRSEQMADMRNGALAELDRSLDGVRVVKRLPSPDRRINRAVAAIHAEQLEALHREASAELAASMASAHVVEDVVFAASPGGSGD